ncbi:MAG: thioredoxin family protein [Flavobacteriaceae bacterium]
MKRTVTILSLLFCLSYLNSQTYNKLEVDDKGNEKLLGKINREGLSSNSFNTWFNKNYDDYVANETLLKNFKDSLSKYKIKVFLGTWCGDSKREVPRFYKVIDAINFPENQLEIIAIDNATETYKQSPNGEEQGLNIHRVPTFIFYKDEKEVNRIVEHPKETFERDIYNIVLGKSYTPNYVAANYIEGMLMQYSLKILNEMESELVSRLSEFVKGSRELNTLGYVKLRAKKYDEAIYIFDLNTKLFPYKENVYDSLGEAFFETKNYSLALKNYQKVLDLNPKHENAKIMIEKIKKDY